MHGDRVKHIVFPLCLAMLSPTPAATCECGTQSFPDAVAAADLVVIGRITNITERAADGSWSMEVTITKALRGQQPSGKVVLGGGRLVGCEWGPDEFTIAGGLDRAWAFALEGHSLWNGRYWLFLCNQNWARVKTPALGGDYTEQELIALAARHRSGNASETRSRTTRS